MTAPINIAIIGYGKMGRELHRLAPDNGFNVISIIDDDLAWKTKEGELKMAQVAIEFSTPDAAPVNIRRCFDLNLPVVSGTTGWASAQKELFDYCESHGRTLFYAPNFSIGVNLFFQLNKKLASMMASHEAFVPSITEVHHIHKLDSPSGTAVALANDINREIARITGWHPGQGDEQTLGIESIRQGEEPGTHIVRYISDTDAIEITHRSFNRSAFALGALAAARWVLGKKGVYNMADFMNL